MGDGLGELIWGIVRVGGIGFFVYAVVVLGSLPFVKGRSIPLGAFELYRQALKIFFWYSMGVYLIVETVFTLFFIQVQIVSLVWPRAMVGMFSLIGVHEDRSSFELWVTYSLLLLVLVMSPYMLTLNVVTRNFKRTALAIAQRILGAGQSLRIVSFRPKRLLPGRFPREMVKRNKAAMLWVERTLPADPHPTTRFSVTSENQDLIEFTDRETRLEFWESEVTFEGEIKKKNSDGKTVWETEVSETLFNGLCVRVRDAFDEPRHVLMIQAREIDEEAKKKTVREEHHYNFIAGILTYVWSGIHDNKLLDSKGCTLDDFQGEAARDDTLGELDENLHYVATKGRDLYLFVHTGLSGNLFEFHLSENVRRNVELFECDLEFVRQRILAVEALLPKLAEKPALAA